MKKFLLSLLFVPAAMMGMEAESKAENKPLVQVSEEKQKELARTLERRARAEVARASVQKLAIKELEKELPRLRGKLDSYYPGMEPSERLKMVYGGEWQKALDAWEENLDLLQAGQLTQKQIQKIRTWIPEFFDNLDRDFYRNMGI